MKPIHYLLLLCLSLAHHTANAQLVRSPREWFFALQGNVKTVTTVLKEDKGGSYEKIDSTISYYARGLLRPDSAVVYFGSVVTFREYYHYSDGLLQTCRSYIYNNAPVTQTFIWLSPTLCAAQTPGGQNDTLAFDSLGRLSYRTSSYTTTTGYSSGSKVFMQYTQNQIHKKQAYSTKPTELTGTVFTPLTYDGRGNPTSVRYETTKLFSNKPFQPPRTDKHIFAYSYTYFD